MTFEPMKEEEVEKPESWFMTMTSPEVVIAVLAVVSFFAFITAKWEYISPK
jgi:hypothetical protein